MLLYSDELFEQHETGQHPENADRLRAIARKLAESGMYERVTRRPAVAAAESALGAVHPREYLEQIQTVATSGGAWLDADTIVSPRSWDVARHAAGSVCEAVREVVTGTDPTALCLTRPPGHHALADRAMGFCLLANVSIAARYAQQVCGLGRILIVDWDVHHGNGTQDIFYADESVTFFSIHRYPFYPGTGAADETGTSRGLGATINVPVRFGTSRTQFRELFTQGLELAARRAQPDLILLSAGFDAHRLDPVGSLGLESEDFSDLTRTVRDVAAVHCQGRIVSVLEGGYHPAALAESVCGHVEELLRDEA